MAGSTRFGPLARAVLRTQSDDRLVALVRDGTEAAFEEIVRRYRAPLVAFAAAYGPPEPEDVVQESLTRSWEALRESNMEMNLKPWLYTIVRNRALNARRDARPTQELPDDLDGVRQPPDVVLEREELERAVAAVSALPEAQRQALVRSALEGHTHEQIATAIGASSGSVRQLIYRARIAVRHGVGAVIPLPLVAAIAQAGGSGAGAVAGAGGAGHRRCGRRRLVRQQGARGRRDRGRRSRAPGSRSSARSCPGSAANSAGTRRPTSPTGRAPRRRDERAASDAAGTATLTPVDDQGPPSARQAGGAAESRGSSSGSSASGAGSTSASGPSGPSSPSSGPDGNDSSGSDGPGPSAEPTSGSSGPGHPGGDSSGPGGNGSDDPVEPVETADHSGPGDGDDPIEPIDGQIETATVEPDEDLSGSGGDDGLDEHSGPGG